MNFRDTPIEGLFVIEPRVHNDERVCTRRYSVEREDDDWRSAKELRPLGTRRVLRSIEKVNGVDRHGSRLYKRLEARDGRSDTVEV